jgi:FolB domain-containing protein
VSDLLRVADVGVDCIIGIHAEERTTPQPLSVSVSFALDTRRAALEESLALSVDYARVVGEVAFVLQHGQFHLIETAAEVVCRTVLSGLDHLDEMELTLTKPRALGGNGAPSLTVRRARDAASSLWTFAFGVVDVVWNVRGLGLYRLRLRGAHGVHLPKQTLVFACDQGRQGELLQASRKLHNASSDVRSFLLLSRPPLRLDEFVALTP